MADAVVDEAQGAMLEFEVTLNRALDEMFTIDYATVDGTARGGEDYSTRAGTLAFAAGSIRKTVSVPVLDDSHNEGAETLELRLSNPSPTRVKLGDASATGTIQNSDPMPTAWMIRLGRTVGSQVLEGVSDRVHGTGSPHMSIGGMQVGNNQGDEPQGGAPDTQWQDKGDPLGARTPEEILRQSSFHWSNADDEAQTGPTVNAWGRFATNRFEAEEGKVTMDGDVTTGLLGVDAQWARGLAGVMLSWTESSGEYGASNEHNAEQGKVRASLAGVYPYASMSLNERIFAWGLIGAGSGELTLEPQGARTLPTDLSLRIGALGLTGQILDGSGPSGIGLNVKSDVLWVSTKNEKTDDLIATSGDVSRLRLRLQGERTFATEERRKIYPGHRGRTSPGRRRRGDRHGNRDRSRSALRGWNAERRRANPGAAHPRRFGLRRVGGKRDDTVDTESVRPRAESVDRPEVGSNREQGRPTVVSTKHQDIRAGNRLTAQRTA